MKEGSKITYIKHRDDKRDSEKELEQLQAKMLLSGEKPCRRLPFSDNLAVVFVIAIILFAIMMWADVLKWSHVKY